MRNKKTPEFSGKIEAERERERRERRLVIRRLCRSSMKSKKIETQRDRVEGKKEKRGVEERNQLESKGFGEKKRDT